MVKTRVIIIIENGKGTETQEVPLPSREDGFFGKLELIFDRGRVVNNHVPMERLPIKPITKEEWEELIGRIDR